LSRLRFFALFAALIALVTAFAACGGGGSSDDPKAVVDEATLQGIESAAIDLSLTVEVKGPEGGKVDVSLVGPFQSEGEGQLPQLDLTAKANGSVNGRKIDFDGSLVLLGSKAFVSYQGTDYEVDSTTFNFVKSVIEKAQRQGGGEESSSDASACQEAFGELDVADFVDGPSDGGSVDVGGTGTTKVSGDLDVSGAIDSLLELAEDPACAGPLNAAGPLPSDDEIEKAKSEVQSALKTAHVDLYVGDDDIVRRISAQLSIEPKRSGSGPDSADVDFDLTLTGVNEDQEIAAPRGAKPLTDLFLKLGINPIELLGLLNQGGLSGPGGLGSLLESLNGGSGDGSSGGGSSSGGGRQAYLKCLGEANTPVDIQSCTRLLR